MIQYLKVKRLKLESIHFMKIFYTTTTQHLRIALPFEYGKAINTRFSDGEIFVKIEEDVQSRDVWVIAATPTPADNYFELFLLLDALNRSGAHIHLLMTYFGYARQDRVQERESCGAAIIGQFLAQINLTKMVVIHAHSKRLHDYLTFEQYIPYELFYPIAKRAEVIVAPDAGARELATRIGTTCRRPVVVAEKKRIARDQVEILAISGEVTDKKVLIVDDMITTGNTIIQVSNKLDQLGARSIEVMATHGVFAGDANERINESVIEKVYVTNSLNQVFVGKKVEVIDIAPIISCLVEPPK